MSVFLTQPMQTKHFLVHIGVGLDLLEYKSRGYAILRQFEYPFEISVKLMVPIILYSSGIIVLKFKHISREFEYKF